MLLAADADCRADRVPDDRFDGRPREPPVEPLRDFEAASPTDEPFGEELREEAPSDDEPDDEVLSDEAASDEEPSDEELSDPERGDDSLDDADFGSDLLSLR